MFSAIITAFDETEDLILTLQSLEDSCTYPTEVIVVNDGSQEIDNPLSSFDSIKEIRHAHRLGVGASRHEAASAAQGKHFVFLDAHHLFQEGCIEQSCRIAESENSIVVPCIRDFEENSGTMHGAYFSWNDEAPPFHAEWKMLPPDKKVSPVSSLKAPAYVIPASIYPKVAWSPLLQGWGGSEACVSLKAFFTGVPILHLCGPIAYHKFKTKFHYPVTWDEIWRNHALIARICFSERTWYDYWLPKIFEPHLNETVQREMDSAEVREEQRAFQKLKVRPDHEFWTRLVFRAVPKSVKIE